MKQNRLLSSNTGELGSPTSIKERIQTKELSISQMDDNMFTVTCYGKTECYPESMRNAIKNEFMMGMLSCDGSEKERYTNVYLDLVNGAKVCSDN